MQRGKKGKFLKGGKKKQLHRIGLTDGMRETKQVKLKLVRSELGRLVNGRTSSAI